METAKYICACDQKWVRQYPQLANSRLEQLGNDTIALLKQQQYDQALPNAGTAFAIASILFEQERDSQHLTSKLTSATVMLAEIYHFLGEESKANKLLNDVKTKLDNRLQAPFFEASKAFLFKHCSNALLEARKNLLEHSKQLAQPSALLH